MNNNNDDHKWFNLVTDSDKNNRKKLTRGETLPK